MYHFCFTQLRDFNAWSGQLEESCVVSPWSGLVIISNDAVGHFYDLISVLHSLTRSIYLELFLNVNRLILYVFILVCYVLFKNEGV